MPRASVISRYMGVASLALLTIGLILLVLPSNQGTLITYTCINGELRGNTTCVFPQAVKINNYVIGNALISINNGQPERLINGSITASKITLISVMRYIKVINETQVTFNIYNPVSKWVNITLPGSCTLTINATIIGSGYVSITVLSNGRVIDYTPYTYSLFITTQASDGLDIFIRPAVTLSCPCIHTIVNVVINGTCIKHGNAFVKSIAYIKGGNTVGNPYKSYALIFLLLSLILLAVSLVPRIN
ncbi:hypothetical protein [Vulcanisaeta sp. JCM 14467]|uniref:hypothetical protein n=1 Tax=Vulcanisaeta sp. JCM 14467 TaxID=1295370 RepID=UPI0006D1B21E|nr:hypothetical protein [Vulcanisaeta sp. JCM 14467]